MGQAKHKNEAIHAVEEELSSEVEALGEPEPQSMVELDTAAELRLGYSNRWQQQEVNLRVNRPLLERKHAKLEAKERAAKIAEESKTWTESMAEMLRAIAAVDAEFPGAKARAREIIEMQRKTRERVKANKLIQCPRCLNEFAEM